MAKTDKKNKKVVQSEKCIGAGYAIPSARECKTDEKR
jgi:hypothetical protein